LKDCLHNQTGTSMKPILVVMLLIGLPAVAAEKEPPAPVGGEVKDVSEFEARDIPQDVEKWPGAVVYRESCLGCHEGQVPKAPHKMFLQMLSGPTIVAALTDGLMATQGKSLTPEQRRHVAEYLSSQPLSAARVEKPPPRCLEDAARFDTSQRPLRAGWGYHNSRFVPANEAGLTPSQVSRLELKWALEFPHALRARSQPSIAYGAVFVGSQDGTVYALDLKTGCVRWTFKASGEVRTAVVPYEAPQNANVRTTAPRLFFADVLARVYSVDAFTGRLAWSEKVDTHANATITATPTLHEGSLYVPVSSLEVTSAADPKYECCTFRGSVVALDAWNGETKWKSYSIAEEPKPVKTTPLGTRIFAPSGAPIWNAPMIDAKRGMLYVGTGENYSSPANHRSDAVLALRLEDGAVQWSQQMLKGDAWNVGCMIKGNPNCPVENGPDVDFGAGTILLTLADGRDVLFAGQKNGMVYALDPDNHGALLWKTRVGRGGIQGGIHFGMAADGTRLYAPISDMKNGRDGRTYVHPARPGMHALDARTGKILWSTLAPNQCGTREFCDNGISAAVTAIPGVVFAGHMDGHFRAYAGDTGKVLFDYDTAQAVATVSGARARGGSFGGAGSAVRDGYVAVNSGYGLYFHMPGNVLFVFAAKP
jgi:polyvinyl alcohol dehydrogenase (cytochrome)